jgi:hypothetical protein
VPVHVSRTYVVRRYMVQLFHTQRTEKRSSFQFGKVYDCTIVIADRRPAATEIEMLYVLSDSNLKNSRHHNFLAG